MPIDASESNQPQQLSFQSVDPTWGKSTYSWKYTIHQQIIQEICEVDPPSHIYETPTHHFTRTGGKQRIELTFFQYRVSGQIALEIIFYANQVTANLPYWYHNAPAVFHDILPTLALIADRGEYNVYDPQVGKNIRLPDDINLMIETYAYTMNMIAREFSDRERD
ncbi:MAG: hypothetical protein AAGK74_02340 [Chloroflexota bacterium]